MKKQCESNKNLLLWIKFLNIFYLKQESVDAIKKVLKKYET